MLPREFRQEEEKNAVPTEHERVMALTTMAQQIEKEVFRIEKVPPPPKYFTWSQGGILDDQIICMKDGGLTLIPAQESNRNWYSLQISEN